MPEVDVTSFECRDEQEFLSDEAYVIINSDSGAQRISDTYTGLDTGDDINLHLKSNFNRSAGIQIWEDDGPKGVSPEDDFIGGLRAFRDDTGTHTVTLQGSGGEYDLTYFVAQGHHHKTAPHPAEIAEDHGATAVGVQGMQIPAGQDGQAPPQRVARFPRATRWDSNQGELDQTHEQVLMADALSGLIQGLMTERQDLLLINFPFPDLWAQISLKTTYSLTTIL